MCMIECQFIYIGIYTCVCVRGDYFVLCIGICYFVILFFLCFSSLHFVSQQAFSCAFFFLCLFYFFFLRLNSVSSWLYLKNIPFIRFCFCLLLYKTNLFNSFSFFPCFTLFLFVLVFVFDFDSIFYIHFHFRNERNS